MKTLILGLGNPILSDDGVGMHVAEGLRQRLDHPDITVAEASLSGLGLLEMLVGFDRAIIIDAIQTSDGEVGKVYRLDPDVFNSAKHTTSPHDVNFTTALELGKKLGLPLPGQIIIYAIEAADVTTFSEECTPAVQKSIPRVIEMVTQELSLTTQPIYVS